MEFGTAHQQDLIAGKKPFCRYSIQSLPRAVFPKTVRMVISVGVYVKRSSTLQRFLDGMTYQDNGRSQYGNDADGQYDRQ
jgi:hypothetical protein